MRCASESLADAVVVHDAVTGEIREVNRKMGDLLGYSPEEVRRLAFGGLVENGLLPPEAKTGTPGLSVWQVRDRSGRQFWVEARLNRTLINGREQIGAVLRQHSGDAVDAASVESRSRPQDGQGGQTEHTICESLVHMANLAGGPDNITVIVVSL